MKTLTKALLFLRKQDKVDQLYYLSVLKCLGRIYKSYYIANPNEELKQSLISLYKHIKNYELNSSNTNQPNILGQYEETD